MARVEWERVGKQFGSTTALADFTLAANDGEVITVLGPSGCGKSTLLRLTAGLEALTHGSIHIGGRRIDGMAPHERDVAMVFQSYALYPHMTVRANIEFPLRMHRVARAQRLRQAEDIARLLEVGDLLEQRPAQLSGGQRQRVALARALVRRPALFLLDEPLSNLDSRLRASVRHYLRDLFRQLGVTTVYVTHDQSEAMTLGDRMVVMCDGRIQQVDAPTAVYERPANTFVAGFIGNPPMNLIPASCADGCVRLPEQHWSLPDRVRQQLGTAPRQVILGLRPEAFVPAPADMANSISAVADPASAEVLGNQTLVRVTVAGVQAIACLPGIAREVPSRLTASIDQLHVFSRSGERLTL